MWLIFERLWYWLMIKSQGIFFSCYLRGLSFIRAFGGESAKSLKCVFKISSTPHPLNGRQKFHNPPLALIQCCVFCLKFIISLEWRTNDLLKSVTAAPFNNTKTLKFKIQLTIACFTAVNLIILRCQWIEIYQSQPMFATFCFLRRLTAAINATVDWREFACY